MCHNNSYTNIFPIDKKYYFYTHLKETIIAVECSHFLSNKKKLAKFCTNLPRKQPSLDFSVSF